jgi:hypothetical protein
MGIIYISYVWKINCKWSLFGSQQVQRDRHDVKMCFGESKKKKNLISAPEYNVTLLPVSTNQLAEN